MDKKIINIEDYYTEKNEADGVWFEPELDGEPCGLEFCMIGIHSDEAIASMEHFDELMNELYESEKDEKIRSQKEKELDAERVASITKGVRASGGGELRKDGKVLEFSKEAIKEFYLNTPVIKLANIDFAIKSTNFMNKKSV